MLTTTIKIMTDSKELENLLTQGLGRLGYRILNSLADAVSPKADLILTTDLPDEQSHEALCRNQGRPVLLLEEELLFSLENEAGMGMPRLIQRIERTLASCLRNSELNCGLDSYRQLLASFADILVLLGPDGRPRYISPSLERITGIHPEVLMGAYDAAEMVHPEDLAAVTSALEACLAQPLMPIRCEFRHLTGTGDYIWLEAMAQNLLGIPGLDALVLVVRDISERKQAAENLVSALHEREILLQEIHHRVKNNFQVILSLINLQIRKIPEQESVTHLLETRNRIRSLALVHDTLYQLANMAEINLADYIKLLARELLAVRPPDTPGVRLELQLAPVCVEVEQAIPCGLLVNELLTNAFKYAFPAEFAGQPTITLSLAQVGTETILRIADNGIGFSPALMTLPAQTLGLQLTQQLVRQLQGSCTLQPGPGTHWEISWQSYQPSSKLRF